MRAIYVKHTLMCTVPLILNAHIAFASRLLSLPIDLFPPINSITEHSQWLDWQSHQTVVIVYTLVARENNYAFLASRSAFLSARFRIST